MKHGWLILLIIILLSFAGCRKDPIFTDPTAKLAFSEDTVLFDTIFTAIGSVTQRLKVYNPYGKTVNISAIHLAGGNKSRYRINIDGESSSAKSDILLKGGDSLYIFVEVTIDPHDAANPMIVTDSILFETNGNLQDVDLVAWGQDFYYFGPGTQIAIGENERIFNDKPWVFYGYSFIDTGAVWIIEPGTQMHFHQYSGLAVLDKASIRMQGTVDDPIIMQGDRLEAGYRDLPNQWGHPYFGGIYLTATSKGNVMENVIVKNGNIGIQVDSVGDPNQPQLRMHNTIVQNMSGVGLLAQGAHVEATNSLFANCGIYAAALTIGGKYNFTHCTFANYWRYDSRDNGMLLINDYYEANNGSKIIRELEQAIFNNCIVYGTKEDEVVFDKQGNEFKVFFDHCLLKTTLDISDASRFNSIITNPSGSAEDEEAQDPVFDTPRENNYRLNSKSPAINAGNAAVTGSINEDIEGNPRIKGSAPDMGAYEFQD